MPLYITAQLLQVLLARIVTHKAAVNSDVGSSIIEIKYNFFPRPLEAANMYLEQVLLPLWTQRFRCEPQLAGDATVWCRGK
jgi:hypothetical protein